MLRDPALKAGKPHLMILSGTKGHQCDFWATVISAPFPTMLTCSTQARRKRLMRDPSSAFSATALVEGAVPFARSGLQICSARPKLAAALHTSPALACHVLHASRREVVYPTLLAASPADARRRAFSYRLGLIAHTTFPHRQRRKAVAGCHSNSATAYTMAR